MSNLVEDLGPLTCDGLAITQPRAVSVPDQRPNDFDLTKVIGAVKSQLAMFDQFNGSTSVLPMQPFLEDLFKNLLHRY